MPVPYVQCEIELPGGRVCKRRSNLHGVVRVDGVRRAGQCRIHVPAQNVTSPARTRPGETRELKSEPVGIDTESVFIVRRPFRRVRLRLIRNPASEPGRVRSLSPDHHEDLATLEIPSDEPWANAQLASGARSATQELGLSDGREFRMDAGTQRTRCRLPA